MERVEAPGVRVGFRTLVSLALCAAAAGAAMAHVAIDVVGDYALTADSYDRLGHGSRELLSGAALILAVVLAGRGLRICCEIAAVNRTRILVSAPRVRETLGFVVATVAASATLVPMMEWLDGRLAGISVRGIDDAFGGSLWLGLVTTASRAGSSPIATPSSPLSRRCCVPLPGAIVRRVTISPNNSSPRGAGALQTRCVSPSVDLLSASSRSSF
jgi:hypothetical protein